MAAVAPASSAQQAQPQVAPKYTGQELDAASGLYYYRARWYDPALGRFIQADSIVPAPGNPQSLNRYAYVYNNPLRYTDPSGRMGSLPLGLFPAIPRLPLSKDLTSRR
jgi:RHS repeat-associated protein